MLSESQFTCIIALIRIPLKKVFILLPLKFIDIVEIVWHILQNIDRQEKAVAGVKANGVRIDIL